MASRKAPHRQSDAERKAGVRRRQWAHSLLLAPPEQSPDTQPAPTGPLERRRIQQANRRRRHACLQPCLQQIRLPQGTTLAHYAPHRAQMAVVAESMIESGILDGQSESPSVVPQIGCPSASDSSSTEEAQAALDELLECTTKHAGTTCMTPHSTPHHWSPIQLHSTLLNSCSPLHSTEAPHTTLH